MKKVFLLAVAVLFTIGSEAQLIGEKGITHKGGYGEKKLKKAPKKIYIAQFAGY